MFQDLPDISDLTDEPPAPIPLPKPTRRRGRRRGPQIGERPAPPLPPHEVRARNARGHIVVPDEKIDPEMVAPHGGNGRRRPQRTLTHIRSPLETMTSTPGMDAVRGYANPREMNPRLLKERDKVMQFSHAPSVPVAGAVGQDGPLELPDISDLIDPPAAPPRRADRRGGQRFDGSPDWTIDKAGEIKNFYRTRTGQDLPISTFGQGSIHNKWNYDHTNALDVGLHPYIKRGSNTDWLSTAKQRAVLGLHARHPRRRYWSTYSYRQAVS